MALVRVLEDTKEHVDEVDENVSDEHSLPEVPWVAHLSEKIEEEHSASVRVDDAVDSLERAEEAGASRLISVGRCASEGLDWDVAVLSSIWEVDLSKRHLDCGTVGAEHGCIVGLGVGGNTDGDEGYQDSSKNGEVGEPSEALESANLSKDHAQKSNDEQTDDEADTVAVDSYAIWSFLANGDLGNLASFTENQDGDQHDHLDRL